jgi:hypothetical protein
VQVHHALNPQRIARTLVTVFLLSFIQTVVAPVVAPIVSAPKAEAVTGTVAPSTYTSGTTIVIPTGVFSVTIEAVGGAGGKGGDDVNTGLDGTVAGRTILTLAVTPGDVLGMYPGNSGSAGNSCAAGNGGGAGGASTVPSSALTINGTYFTYMNFSGGRGGNAGAGGCSGAGGGAGAASVATINSEVVAIAGGAGGGGGTGSSSNLAANWGGSLIANGTSFTGETGTSTVTCTGSHLNSDGGGGGGGGGGYYGGKGGLAPLVVNECAGVSGSPGGNYLVSRATSKTDDRIAQTAEGYVKYTYNAEATTTCATTSTVVDIYTVEKVTYTGYCNWTVPSSVSVIDYFMVGGGAGGSGDGGGGGGGGASVLRTAVAVTPSSTLTLKVGYGGGPSTWGSVSNAYIGATTTITINGSTVTASGGATSTNGPGQGGGVGGTAINGGFAGGQGGTGGSCYGVGTAGKTGSSNYFYGVKNEYGGGGGGGSCPNGTVQTAPAGASGGGAGGYASSSTVNQPGSNGTDGTGGGGGGGTATGTGLKLAGGKGGSGVILIRYATNSADAFPVALSSSLAGRWIPDGLQVLDSSRLGWTDSSGYYTAGVVTGAPTVTTTGTMDGANSTGSSKTNLVASGNTSAKATLIASNIPNYTVFHIARYVTGGTQSRIITAKDNNWLSGHYSSTNYKTAYHNNDWMTPYVSADVKWLLSTDQVRMYRANGSDITYSYSASQVYNSTTSPTGFGINNYSTEQSNWQTLDILAFNRQLTNGEIRSMEAYLARIYGLTLSYEFQHAETDTAMSFNGNQYFYTQYTYNNVINDTFTIEAWIKPSSTCAATRCVVFSKEYAVMFGVLNGSLYYIMYGTSTAWQWVDNIYKIPMDEWHHIALVKRGVANTNGGIDIYVDGQLVYTKAGSPYLTSTSNVTFSATDVIRQNDDQWTYIGTRLDTLDRFYGNIDEVKVWKVARTANQISSDLYSTDTSDTQLQYYWDFNKAVGSTSTRVPNLAAGGPSRGDLIPVGTTTYSDVKVTATSAAYTTVTFPRPYLNQFGGWKTPDSITAVTTLIVGGGGGGGWNSGSGGSGGDIIETTTQISPGFIRIYVGPGGRGSLGTGTVNLYPDIVPSGGYSSNFGDLWARGGLAGTHNTGSGAPAGGGSVSGYGAGGSGSTSSSKSGGAGAAGGISSITGTSTRYGGGGGGGAWDTSSNGGAGGSGGGGAGGGLTTTTGTFGTGNLGGGGGASSARVNAGSGGSGVVIVRWITALKPSFTKPTNAYLNVGMTETFTTNVSQDSETAQLTRTFRWESTTAGAGGTFTPIKVGTGAANAAFSWIPSDTSTTGSQYLYRVVVTDSDTAGLFIQDTSTAVYAIINGTLTMTGVSSIKKQINISRNETFTIAAGTPTYRYTLTPVIAGITLDTSTVGFAVLKISDTASAGTYLETLTVIDSVSASVVVPLSISISAPPVLIYSAEMNSKNIIFDFDAGNSASYNLSTGALADVSGTKKSILVPNGATYSSDYSGILSFKSGSSQYMSATSFTQYNAYTIETWIRLDAAIPDGFCPLTSEYNPTNISFVLCVDAGRTIYGGFHNGSWTYKRSNEVIPLNSWTHLVSTYDGTTVNLYINGETITVMNSNTAAGAVPPQPSTNRIFINKSYATAVGSPPSASYGPIRMYSTGFSFADVQKNYKATKDRFATINLKQIYPTQKYGTLNLESFTVINGGDTRTVSFSVGNRQGVTWDTATAGVVNLSVQESLTPGTYYDTITVTDNFAQTTTLPIQFTVSKADTITVVAGAAPNQVYNKSPASSLPNFTINGLVSSDTGTVVRNYTGVDWTKPCSQGGGCEVGDTGPGGGTIFYISPTAINASTGISAGGVYLEVAPKNWWGTNSETTTAWAKVTTSVTGTLSSIGSGAENTRLITAGLTTNAVAAKLAADLTLNGKSDWFLPSTSEVKEIYDALYVTGLSGGFTALNYWSSTQSTSSLQADTYWFGSGLISPTAKTNSYALRPIRAYSPDTVTVSSIPTDADSYTVTVETITMTTGSLSYYQNVVFQKSGLEITKAKQDALNVQLYGATFGLPFTITLLGGSGSGAVTESLTAGSTATGCAVANHIMTSSTAGTCNLLIKKAASRNYLLETQTAVVYFLNWVINQPSNQVGGGSTIGLNGVTSVTLDPNAAPTITSLSTYTATAGVTSIVINGAGFNHLDTANITVKFWRNKVASGFTVNAADSQITVTVPVGATTGKVTVTTPNGIAVTELALTITP